MSDTGASYSNTPKEVENGWDLFRRLTNSLVIVPTGSASVDEATGGGLWAGEVTELVGELACGKTQLCMSTIVQMFLRDKGVRRSMAVYLDSNGSFRSSRLVEILRRKKPHVSDEEVSDLLSRVLVKRVSDDTELSKALLDVQKLCQHASILMLIVDSVGGCLSGTAAKMDANGRKCQKKIIRQLRLLAREHCMAVVTVNHLVYWTGKMRPALGQIWMSAPHTRLRFLREHDGHINVRLINSQRQQCYARSGECQLTESGVVDLPDFQPADATFNQSHLSHSTLLERIFAGDSQIS
uniref:RecA family profile 1 domain-containing protein n=1 Tax=Plectus sambesii TaxID=2011161 RepID=A0A914UKG0_9BILA